MNKIKRKVQLKQNRQCSINKVKNCAKKFKEKSVRIHGNKYNYSKFKYTGVHNKSIIICSKHGEFKITPNEHLNGNGCPKCGELNRKKFLNSLKKIDWKEKAEEIFDNKYDYSKFQYINNKTKGIIICPEHGEFIKDMNHHLNRKQGCPKCSKERLESNGELIIKKFLINNNIKFKEQFIIKNNKYLKNKPYDFYLEDYNLIIEFQGEQHFKCKWFMTENDLKNRQKIDKNKKELAQFYKFNFLEIKFTDDILKVLSSTTIESK